MNRSIIITGGAGFIGSHVVRLFVNKYPQYKIINLDKLTYAGNPANLASLKDDFQLMTDVEGGGRFVQKQDLRLLSESHGDPRALPLAAGKHRYAAVLEVVQMRAVDGPFHRFAVSFRVAGA